MEILLIVDILATVFMVVLVPTLIYLIIETRRLSRRLTAMCEMLDKVGDDIRATLSDLDAIKVNLLAEQNRHPQQPTLH